MTAGRSRGEPQRSNLLRDFLEPGVQGRGVAGLEGPAGRSAVNQVLSQGCSEGHHPDGDVLLLGSAADGLQTGCTPGCFAVLIAIAGDAAHLFTPTGGLGYNTAVGDAVNLGWKLAAVIKGQAHAALLESYEQERRPIGLRNTAYARDFADSVGLFEVTPALEADGDEGEGLRTQASEVLNAHVRREFNIPGVTFGERVDASPLVFSEPDQVPPDQANAYVPSTAPGGRLPHRWLPGARSLYDVLGFEWTVLAPPPLAAEAERLAQAGRSAGWSVSVLELSADEVGDLLDGGLLLVRPDQVVAWRGVTVADARSIWRRVAWATFSG